MSLSVSTTYAGRSLLRHARRTILSILGIGLATGVSLFMVAFVRGESGMMLRAAAESGNGHFRLVPAAWCKTRDDGLRLSSWKGLLASIRSMDGVRVATPHARTEALLAFGTRSVGVLILGVDASTEASADRLVHNVVQGRYLRSGDLGTAVVGRSIATRLDVGLDDPLMATVAAADGQMRGAMLRIVGIVSTGSEDLDATICHVNLEDIEALSGLPGAGEITVIVREPEYLDRTIARVRERLPAGVSVITWRELMPELAAGTQVDRTWTRLTVGIVMIVAFLGIASAQLAAVLERRREFAVLAALGMRSGRLVHVMLMEGIVLGLLGALVGLTLGGGAAYYVHTEGIDFGRLYGQGDWTMSNVLIDPVFFGDFGVWLIPLAFVLALGATLLSSLYPAWYAVRTDPAHALRVEN